MLSRFGLHSPPLLLLRQRRREDDFLSENFLSSVFLAGIISGDFFLEELNFFTIFLLFSAGKEEVGIKK